MFEYLSQHKEQLELLYLLSAPLMIFGVFIAWLQLRSIKRDLKAKYKREAIREVFNSIDGFNDAATMSFKLEKKLDKAGLWDNRPEVTGFDYASLPKDCEWVQKFENHEECYNYSIDFLNFLEPMSQRILSGLADERFAYKIEGTFFMRLIESHQAIIAAHRSSGNESTFVDSIELYNLWKHRSERQKAGAKLYSEVKKFLSMPKDKGKDFIQ